jgi:Protein of unknown function (DUF2934)
MKTQSRVNAKIVRSKSGIPRELIEQRAYVIWQRRGCPPGTAIQDWMQAEKELETERRCTGR